MRFPSTLYFDAIALGSFVLGRKKKEQKKKKEHRVSCARFSHLHEWPQSEKTAPASKWLW
jgi:hypothetical protein